MPQMQLLQAEQTDHIWLQAAAGVAAVVESTVLCGGSAVASRLTVHCLGINIKVLGCKHAAVRRNEGGAIHCNTAATAVELLLRARCPTAYARSAITLTNVCCLSITCRAAGCKVHSREVQNCPAPSQVIQLPRYGATGR